ncbi:S8 family serine peptidase [Myxacorys almedinensis]|uniref:S8 family serine peptidase n=1 Tax=Myxacorys almedinensis A TaxID=2690445 RepID=A0A8J7Z2W4_9CYAN|nr:S8 family serine peptidase [Myxacorys almedinensis]NDJ19027.1 S8 family serine peptidase [Myxacorys almedinensis A]
MTNQPNLPDHEPGNASISAQHRGSILQRGGEELLLEKVDDRFAVNATSKEAAWNLVNDFPTERTQGAAPSKLTELVVDPAQKDQVMQQIRALEQVNYASHIYQFQDTPGSQVYLTNEITIQFAPAVNADERRAIAQEFGVEQVKQILGIPNAFVFQLTNAATENPLKITNRLITRPGILTAEPNIIVQQQALYRPSDPMYPKQWHLHHNGGADLAAGSHVFAEQAWDVTRGSRAIAVAVMDDAVDLNHPDFQGVGKIVAPRDFRGKDFLPLPDETGEDHGTACAGVAVAEENGYGVVGVAPECALMPIRTTGFLDDETIEALFGWAVDRGAAVISCSWGPSAVYYPPSLRQKAAITRAATTGRNGKGCVIVFAAGNANRPTNGTINESGWQGNVISGATKWLGGFTAHPDVITVSACTSLNKKAAYSNWGAEISVCAPSNNAPPGLGLPELGYVYTPPQIRVPLRGLGVFTADLVGDRGYDRSNFASDFGGTSSACPLVAGVAALVLSANPDLSAQEVRQILQQTADKITDTDADPQLGLRKGTYELNGRCDWFGYGKVNAAKAVQAAVQRRSLLSPTRSISAQNVNPASIPDNSAQGVISAVQVNDAAAVRDVQVSVGIDHTYLGDIEVSLISPLGTVVLLQGRTLGRRTQLQVVYTLQTTPTLRRLLGQSAQGQWQLRVVDAIANDTGTLNFWKLTLGV